jgi:FMN-dependent NADH-azoreductase
MPTLLVVEASPRGDNSISRGLPYVTMPWLAAYFTPPDQQTAEIKTQLQLSDELVAEILAADHIAIGTPVYNYNIPAVLKAYIDHIVRKGKTLGFAGEGLVHGKTCTILMASGGEYTEGSPIRDRDIATQYLRLILKVIGINDVTVVAGGNAKSVDLGQTTRAAFIEKFAPEILSASRVDLSGFSEARLLKQSA